MPHHWRGDNLDVFPQFLDAHMRAQGATWNNIVRLVTWWTPNGFRLKDFTIFPYGNSKGYVFCLRVHVQPSERAWVVANSCYTIITAGCIVFTGLLSKDFLSIELKVPKSKLHNCLDLSMTTIPMSDLFCRMVSQGEYIHSTHNPSTIQPTASTPSADAAPRILFVTYLDAARKLEFEMVGPCWTFRTGFFWCYFPPKPDMTMEKQPWMTIYLDMRIFQCHFCFLWGVYLLWKSWQGCSIAVYFEWFAQNIVLTESRVYIYISYQ